MPKTSKAPKQFQKWLRTFRATGVSGHVLTAASEMTDEQLHEHWRSATRLANRKPRAGGSTRKRW